MAERFGVGALEINRASEAKPGELLTCLNSGLTAVMNPTTGKVMSYDYITRFKNTYEKFRSKMITDGTVGKIGKIDITDNTINILKSDELIATGGLIVSDKKVSFVRLGLDVDIISAATGINIPEESTATVVFTVAKDTANNLAKSYTITDTISNINSKITSISYTGFETVSETLNNNFTFDSIKITLPVGKDPLQHTIILNSILVSYKEV